MLSVAADELEIIVDRTGVVLALVVRAGLAAADGLAEALHGVAVLQPRLDFPPALGRELRARGLAHYPAPLPEDLIGERRCAEQWKCCARTSRRRIRRQGL